MRHEVDSLARQLGKVLRQRLLHGLLDDARLASLAVLARLGAQGFVQCPLRALEADVALPEAGLRCLQGLRAVNQGSLLRAAGGGNGGRLRGRTVHLLSGLANALSHRLLGQSEDVLEHVGHRGLVPVPLVRGGAQTARRHPAEHLPTGAGHRCGLVHSRGHGLHHCLHGVRGCLGLLRRRGPRHCGAGTLRWAPGACPCRHAASLKSPPLFPEHGSTRP
mmetsp:Transcript_39220/g.117160  ORF Transcript_39220/g.117160 Transcript_39220/m.117160 type:complete len:220 (+) Transcript_39220:628-1287(+)